MKLINSIIVSAFFLSACSHTVDETRQTTAVDSSHEKVSKRVAYRSAGKPTAPIHMDYVLSEKIHLHQLLEIPLQFTVAKGSELTVDLLTDEGLLLVEPQNTQIHLSSDEQGKASVLLKVLPQVSDKLYLNLHVTVEKNAQSMSRSFTLPIAVDGLQRSSKLDQVRSGVNANKRPGVEITPAGRAVISMPAYETHKTGGSHNKD